MKAAFVLWLAMVVLVHPVMGQDKGNNYSQSYSIFMKGALSGSEVVSEKTDTDGNLVSSSDHEIFVTEGTEAKRMAFSARMVLSKETGLPFSYSCRYTTGPARDSYEVTVNNGQITRILNRGGQSSEVSVAYEPDMVILDFNVYHQYDYLVRRYDVKKGGRQLFANFLPVIGTDIPLALTFLGNGKIEHPNGVLEVRSYRVEFINIWSGTFSVDQEGRLVRLTVPAQDLEVLRSDLTASYNQQ